MKSVYKNNMSENTQSSKTILITGAAGFVGANLVEKILNTTDYKIVAYDNLSTGFVEHLLPYKGNPRFIFNKKTIDESFSSSVLENVDCIIHLAALADISNNKNNYSECLEKNINVTNHLIEAAIQAGTKKFLFASTCSVYGDPNLYPSKENEICDQTSVYAATKIASEKILEGFANTFDMQVYSMRFVSMLGPRYSHGHVYDFVKKILNGDKKLNILGNGGTLKSYLHIQDAVDAIIHLISYDSETKFEAYNVGHPNAMKLKYSVNAIVERTNYKGEIEYGKESTGWVGDNPVVMPCVDKLISTGWNPKYDLRQSIFDTVDWIVNNQWVFHKGEK